MAPPPTSLRYFVLTNNNNSDTIYPVIYDVTGQTVLWDGSSSPDNKVGPHKQLTIDVSTVTPPITDQTIVILGCKVDGSKKQLQDLNNPRTYAFASPNTANGTYLLNGTFAVDPAMVAGVDPAAFQEAYLKLNNPAVAKLLVTIANLISPEIAQIA